MNLPYREIAIDISGLGIIMYSPQFAAHIPEGTNYLRSHYLNANDVQEHIQNGTIVGFGTSSPGRFLIRLYFGYPSVP